MYLYNCCSFRLQLWKKLGFTCTTYDNLSCTEMDAKVSSLAQRDHSAYDCVIVCILTHGDEQGILCGSDDNEISVDQLLAYFSDADKARSLAGKPKLFFIQVRI